MATADLHSAADAALRIVPAVAPLAADPIEDVRSHALAALDCFLKQLRAAHEEQSAAAREAGDTGKAGLPGRHFSHTFHLCDGTMSARSTSQQTRRAALHSSLTGLRAYDYS